MSKAPSARREVVEAAVVAEEHVVADAAGQRVRAVVAEEHERQSSSPTPLIVSLPPWPLTTSFAFVRGHRDGRDVVALAEEERRDRRPERRRRQRAREHARDVYVLPPRPP